MEHALVPGTALHLGESGGDDARPPHTRNRPVRPKAAIFAGMLRASLVIRTAVYEGAIDEGSKPAMIRRVPLARAFGISAVLLIAAPLGVTVARKLRRPRPSEPTPLMAAAGPPVEPPSEPLADWCAVGFEPIAGEACFAAAPRAATAVIVYLHGRYARTASGEEMDRQRRLAARATARGYAVLAFRGGLGTCVAAELADWFCWPSNDRNAGAAATLVAGWTRALTTAHERAGAAARFVLGFSNGGYFAALIASRGLLQVDAFVVAHGGPVEPVHPIRGKPPMLLLSADDDVAQDDMIAFGEELAREQWAHDSYARAGGHGLSDEDIDAAIAFFSRAKERLPLDPPLALHRPLRHTRDAGATPVESNESTALRSMDDLQPNDEPPNNVPRSGLGDDGDNEPDQGSVP